MTCVSCEQEAILCGTCVIAGNDSLKRSIVIERERADNYDSLLTQVNHVAGLDDYRGRMKRARALMDPYFNSALMPDAKATVPVDWLALSKLRAILNNDENKE
jgi:hypothetical protein